MAEGVSLENWSTRKGIEGSNPSPSARLRPAPLRRGFVFKVCIDCSVDEARRAKSTFVLAIDIS